MRFPIPWVKGLALSLAITSDLQAASVMTLFRRSSVEFPPNTTRCATTQATFQEPGLRDALLAFGVDSLCKAFPEATLADTFYAAGDGIGLRLVDYTGFVVLQITDSTQIHCFCDTLASYPSVTLAQAGGGAEASAIIPNDPLFPQQWGLHNTGQLGGVPDSDIDAPEAWEKLIGSNSPPVGVIDAPTPRSDHEDLAGRVTGDIGSPGLHASHVVGIIAASTHNALGISGVNGAAEIYYRQLPNADPSGEMFDAEIGPVFDDVFAHGCRLINCSWKTISAPPPQPRRSLTLECKVSDLYKLDALVIAAMGNSGDLVSPSYLAATAQGAVAVAAINRRNQRWTLTPAGGSQRGPHTDLAAPGDSILSTLYATTSSYGLASGTSMATPHVTGAASLMLGVNHYLHNDDIEQILRFSADDIGVPGWDPETGMGRLNVARALEYLQAPWVIVGNSTIGGTAVDSTAVYPALMLGVVGLPEGRYDVRRVEVRAPIYWGAMLPTVVGAWGRGALSRGFAPGDTLFGAGWCEPVAGTVAYGGAIFRTHVYRVWDQSTGADLGYFPSAAGSVLLSGAVLGQFAAGCPQLEAASLGQWRPVRTVLRRLPAESSAVDCVSLPEWATLDGELNLRLIENSDDITSLRDARLLRVTTATEHEVVSAIGGVRAGRYIAPERVRSSVRGDISDALLGRTGYSLSPGETLLVDAAASSARAFTATGEGGHDSIIIDDGGKDGTGPAPGAAIALSGLSTRDAEVLARTGIELWADDGTGKSTLVDVRYP